MRHRGGLPAAALVPVAALAWWVVGYLPWLAAGLRGPSPDGATAAGGGVGATRLALPLTTPSLSLLMMGALFGGVVAGVSGLASRSDRRIVTTLASLAGVAVAVAVTAGQSVQAIRAAAAGDFAADPRVLTGLCLLLALTALVGWACGAVAVVGRTGVGLALAVVAGAAPAWLSSSLLAWVTVSPQQWADIATSLRWIQAGLLALALVVIGRMPWSRLAWWPVALVLAWLPGPAFTVAGYLEPMLRPPAGAGVLYDAFDAGFQVFGDAASLDNRPLAPWVVAVGLGVALALFLPLLPRSADSVT